MDLSPLGGEPSEPAPRRPTVCQGKIQLPSGSLALHPSARCIFMRCAVLIRPTVYVQRSASCACARVRVCGACHARLFRLLTDASPHSTPIRPAALSEMPWQPLAGCLPSHPFFPFLHQAQAGDRSAGTWNSAGKAPARRDQDTWLPCDCSGLPQALCACPARRLASVRDESGCRTWAPRE